MENWPVRSTMNAQRPSNAERKEFGQGAGSVLLRNTRSFPQSLQGHTRGGRPTRGRRERQLANLDQYDVSCRNTVYGGDLETTEEHVQQTCGEGYLNSSKLLVLPGSFATGSLNDNMNTWDSLVMAVHLVNEDVACPICLYSPVFPRMERCGHVYCGPCAIQYIKYENDLTAKKCAVCSWILRLEDLKRVRLKRVSPVSIGSNLDLVLLKRSNLNGVFEKIVPVEPSVTSESNFNNYQFIEEVDVDEFRSSMSDELHALKAYKTLCVDDGNVELVPHISYLISELENALKDDKFIACNPSTDVRSHDLKSEKLSSVPDDELIADHHPSSSESFCFYQACDGQLIFLDGLMWKCLLAEYNGVSNLPSILNVTVSGVKTHKMSFILRKRWRYLSHIPLGRTFSMIEVKLETLVSQSTLDQFSSALSIRQTEHMRRQMEDMRLTQLKEAAENHIPTLPQGFKLCGHAELSDQRLPPDPSEFVPLCASTQVHQKSHATSFAEVTKMGAKSVVDRNRIATFARNSSNAHHVPQFNPSTELWPSLNDPTTRENPRLQRTGQSRTSWRLSLFEPIGFGNLDSTTSVEQSSNSCDSNQRSSKKSRRRRSRLTDNT